MNLEISQYLSQCFKTLKALIVSMNQIRKSQLSQIADGYRNFLNIDMCGITSHTHCAEILLLKVISSNPVRMVFPLEVKLLLKI